MVKRGFLVVVIIIIFSLSTSVSLGQVGIPAPRVDYPNCGNPPMYIECENDGCTSWHFKDYSSGCPDVPPLAGYREDYFPSFGKCCGAWFGGQGCETIDNDPPTTYVVEVGSSPLDAADVCECDDGVRGLPHLICTYTEKCSGSAYDTDTQKCCPGENGNSDGVIAPEESICCIADSECGEGMRCCNKVCAPNDQCCDNDGDGYDGFDLITCYEGRDCDDNDKEISPGFTMENIREGFCTDGKDNDCDDGEGNWDSLPLTGKDNADTDCQYADCETACTAEEWQNGFIEEDTSIVHEGDNVKDRGLFNDNGNWVRCWCYNELADCEKRCKVEYGVANYNYLEHAQCETKKECMGYNRDFCIDVDKDDNPYLYVANCKDGPWPFNNACNCNNHKECENAPQLSQYKFKRCLSSAVANSQKNMDWYNSGALCFREISGPGDIYRRCHGSDGPPVGDCDPDVDDIPPNNVYCKKCTNKWKTDLTDHEECYDCRLARIKSDEFPITVQLRDGALCKIDKGTPQEVQGSCESNECVEQKSCEPDHPPELEYSEDPGDERCPSVCGKDPAAIIGVFGVKKTFVRRFFCKDEKCQPRSGDYGDHRCFGWEHAPTWCMEIGYDASCRFDWTLIPGVNTINLINHYISGTELTCNDKQAVLDLATDVALYPTELPTGSGLVLKLIRKAILKCEPLIDPGTQLVVGTKFYLVGTYKPK